MTLIGFGILGIDFAEVISSMLDAFNRYQKQITEQKSETVANARTRCIPYLWVCSINGTRLVGLLSNLLWRFYTFGVIWNIPRKAYPHTKAQTISNN